MTYLWYWPSGGYDFDCWKAEHDWQPVTSPQSGRNDLMPLVTRGATQADWLQQRTHWMQITDALLGEINDRPPKAVAWETLEARDTATYTARRIRYLLTDEEWGYAWLLVPRGTAEPCPAVIALHQTVPQGKNEPVGLEGDPELAYGKELAERGFAVLAPDAIAFGDRLQNSPTALYHSAEQFFAAHPQGSVMRKMVYDVQRAVDLLEQLPEVDSARIGCIGHSHGGYGTLFAMLYEPRLRAGVISCGITAFRTDPSPHRWWQMTALMPRLGYYAGHMEQTPLDFHHWVALLAPRPLLVSAALDDSIFPDTDNMPQLLERARQVYRLTNAPGSLHSWIFQGSHRFPREARTRAYHLFRETLG